MVTAHCGSGTGSRKGLVVGGQVEALHMNSFYVSFARTEAMRSSVHVALATGVDHVLREVPGRPEQVGE